MLASTTTNGPHAAAPAVEGLGAGKKKGPSTSVHVGSSKEPVVAGGAKRPAEPQKPSTSFAALLKQARDLLPTGHLAQGREQQTANQRRAVPGETREAIHSTHAPTDEAKNAAQRALALRKSASPVRSAPAGRAEVASLGKNQESETERLRDSKKHGAGSTTPQITLTLEVHSLPTEARKLTAATTAEKGTIEPPTGKSSAVRHEPKVTVADFRRSPEGRKVAAAKAEGSAVAHEAKGEGQEPLRHKQPDQPELARGLSLDTGKGAGGLAPAHGETSSPSSSGTSFQNLLAEQLRDSWNGEIVKNAHIVLRDGDSGTIRLRLKPESLGNVKIELNLTDNNISGKIVVQSDEAKHAFERNMANLADAFRQGGFDSAKLEVSVGSGSQQNSGSFPGGDSSAPFYSGRLREALAPLAPSPGLPWAGTRAGAVNILA